MTSANVQALSQRLNNNDAHAYCESHVASLVALYGNVVNNSVKVQSNHEVYIYEWTQYICMYMHTLLLLIYNTLQVCSKDWWKEIHKPGSRSSFFTTTARLFFGAGASSKTRADNLKKICLSLTPGIVDFLQTCVDPVFYEPIPDKHTPTPNTTPYILTLRLLALGGGGSDRGACVFTTSEPYTIFEKSINGVVKLLRIILSALVNYYKTGYVFCSIRRWSLSHFYLKTNHFRLHYWAIGVLGWEIFVNL